MVLEREEKREKERMEREREKNHQCERETQRVASFMLPDKGSNPQLSGVWDGAPTN